MPTLFVVSLSQNFLQFWRSALEQKKAEQQKVVGAIDYDAPTEKNSGTVGLGTKVILTFLPDIHIMSFLIVPGCHVITDSIF